MLQIKNKACRAENCGRSRATWQIKYIVVHYTSNLGDTAKNNADYFAREKLKNPASAHYFVDENEIWCSVIPSIVAYHVGAKAYRHPECRNANSLGVEICMLDKQGNVRKGAIAQAAKLVYELMRKYDVPLAHVLRHYDVTDKDCPAPMVANPGLWTDFRLRICALDAQEREQEDDMTIYKTYEDCPAWAKPTVQKLVHLGLLTGDENGILNLEHNALRNLVINDRAGLYK